MAKSRTRSEVEHLKGIIKELKKEIGRKEKLERRYQDLESKEAEALEREAAEKYKESVPIKDRCPNCRGELQCVEIGVVKLITCDNCKYRVTKRSK